MPTRMRMHASIHKLAHMHAHGLTILVKHAGTSRRAHRPPVHALMTRATSASVTSPWDTSSPLLAALPPPRRAWAACCVAL